MPGRTRNETTLLITNGKKGSCSIMQNRSLTLVALGFLLASAGSVPAPASEQACVIVLEGRNRNRTVAGAVNVECGHPEETHTAPFGNWAVSSNYSHLLEDGNQFRGWKPVDDRLTKQHWNSCTTAEEEYRAPDCDLYNAPGPEGSCRTQSSSASRNARPHVLPDPDLDAELPGRRRLPRLRQRTTAAGSRGLGNASRQLHDPVRARRRSGGIAGDGHDRVAALRFPGVSVTLTDCGYDGCPEQASGWVESEAAASSSSSAQVEAELRMRARAYLEGYCDWAGSCKKGMEESGMRNTKRFGLLGGVVLLGLAVCAPAAALDITGTLEDVTGSRSPERSRSFRRLPT